MIRPLLLLGSLVFANSLRAEPPTAMYVFPAGAQRGTVVETHVGGLFLNKTCQFEILGSKIEAPPQIHRVPSKWFEGPLLHLPESQRQEDYPQAMSARIKIQPDAELGNHGVRLWTSQGVTTPLRFVVGDLPEIVEQEVDGAPIPVAVQTPVTVNGRIFPREDVDVWTVKLTRGQTLTCMVNAARIGSPLSALLDVRDAENRRIAESSQRRGGDPRLAFTAPADGEYAIRITDVRADGGPAYVYRLTLTTGNVVEHVYPLGGRRGTAPTFEITTTDGNTQRVKAAIPPEAGKAFALRFPLDGKLTDPASIDVDGLPEVMESESSTDPIKANFLNVPAIGNGRIRHAGEVDTWSFAGNKGETFDLELRAARLGSPLLGVVSVLDSTGKELAKAEPGAGPNADPVIKFSVPQDGLYRVQVQDRFRSRGGLEFAYRLRIAKPHPDFELQLGTASLAIPRPGQANLRILASRSGGMTGPIHLRIAGLPEGITGPKEAMIAANQVQVDIPLKADASAKITSALVQITGTGFLVTPFTAYPIPISRKAVVPMSGDDRPIEDVRIATTIPTPFKIVGEYVLSLVPRGTVYTRKFKIERNNFTGPIAVSLADKQARHLQGVTGPTITIPGDKNEFEYAVNLPPWMDTGRTCRVCVMGTAIVKDADGNEHVVTFSSREQNEQIIAVVEPERLGMYTARNSLRIVPDSTIEIPVEVRRGEGMVGEAAVTLIVPEPMRGISANSLTIAKNTDRGTLIVKCAPDAKGPFPLPVTIRVTVQEQGRPVIAEKNLILVGGGRE